MRPRDVNVRIPAGVADGQRIRLKGRGTPGMNGGPAGDLFVMCHVTAHKIFSRDGSHLTVRLPITFAEAALGADIEVPTLSGEAVTLRLKAGTQSGSRHRVKGKGIASAKTTGDLIVSVDVVVPTVLTEDQKDAVVAFAKASDDSPRDNVLAQAKQAKRAAS
jgi:molecular chaperone DnaJ